LRLEASPKRDYLIAERLEAKGLRLEASKCRARLYAAPPPVAGQIPPDGAA